MTDVLPRRMKQDSNLFIGLMSGTSMDAVDCALVEVDLDDRPRLLDFLNTEIPPPLKTRLLALCRGEAVRLSDLGEADIELGRLFARSVQELLAKHRLEPEQIAAIGSHGQTIWHQPPRGEREKAPFSIQIGDPNTIAELTGITTIADFRRRDMAAGGEGAPLLPLLHRHVFHDATRDRIVLNLGGIANVTILPASGGNATGFDTGPANVLMDTWIREHKGKSYDDLGVWAASGKASEALLDLLLDDDYFALRPPKSTGRERFNTDWLARKLSALSEELPEQDVQATLLELTAVTIADAIRDQLDAGEVIVCGGGARNEHLLRSLRQKLPAFEVMTSTHLGLESDSVEAVGFAWFASRTLAGRTVDLTRITGSRHPVIMGGIYQGSGR